MIYWQDICTKIIEILTYQNKRRLKKIIYSILLVLLFSQTSLLKAQSDIEILHEELYSHLDKKGYDSSAFYMAENLFNKTINISPSTASEYGAICQQAAFNVGDSLMIAKSKNLRGISFMRQKTYFMATQSFFAAYEIYIKFEDKRDIAFTLLNIGNSYLDQDLEDIGEAKINEALSIYNEIQDSIGVADCYASLGKAYFGIEDNKAIRYFFIAIEIFTDKNENIKLATTYNLLAKAYLNVAQDDKATNYLTKAIEIFEEEGLKLKKAETYQIMADAFYMDEKYVEALEYNNYAKNIFEEEKSTEDVAETVYKIALVSFEMKNYQLAINTAQEAIDLASFHNNLKLESHSYKIIANSYKFLNNLKKSVEYYELYEETIIEYYEEKNSRDFSAFQMNLETQSAKQEVEYLKIKNEKEKLQFSEKQSRRNLIFSVVVGLLVLLYLIFMIFRLRERKKATISLKRTNNLLKNEIEERKKAEIQAQGQEARYKLLFRKTPIGILQFDDDLIITDANERFSEIFNKNTKEVLNKHLNRVFDRKTVHDISNLINSSEDIIKTNTEIPTKKEVVYISLTVKKYSLWTNDGELTGGIIILEDFTEHKKAERYYRANILSKQKLIKQLPDDLILLDKEDNIIEIHFPDAPEREIGVAKLEDVFSERHANVFKSHLFNANKEDKNTQFFFSDGVQNYLVRITPSENTTLIIISHFEAEAKDAGIIIKSNEDSPKTTKKKYMEALQDEIEELLLPAYQNIQRGLSFIMIKGFAEKCITIGKKHNNNKIREYGEQLFDFVTSFNVVKVNKQLEKFPTLISEFMGLGTKFIQ